MAVLDGCNSWRRWRHSVVSQYCCRSWRRIWWDRVPTRHGSWRDCPGCRRCPSEWPVCGLPSPAACKTLGRRSVAVSLPSGRSLGAQTVTSYPAWAAPGLQYAGDDTVQLAKNRHKLTVKFEWTYFWNFVDILTRWNLRN